MTHISELAQYVPVGLLIVVVLGFGVTNLILPTLIGKKRLHGDIKDTPYECGVPAITEAHARFSVKFYLVAMLFILFDIEVVFLLGWGAVFRDLVRPESQGGIGMSMLWSVVLFLGLLEVGHLYAWKKGALDWAPARKSSSLTSET